MAEIDAEPARLGALRADLGHMLDGLPSTSCPELLPGTWCPAVVPEGGDPDVLR